MDVEAQQAVLAVGQQGGAHSWVVDRTQRGIEPIGRDFVGEVDACGQALQESGELWSTFYVEVEDPQATLDKANALGGSTAMPVTEVAGATIAMLKDLDNLPIGLVKAPAAASGVYGSEPSEGSGEMLDWFEVIGSDAGAERIRIQRDHFGGDRIDAAGGDHVVREGIADVVAVHQSRGVGIVDDHRRAARVQQG